MTIEKLKKVSIIGVLYEKDSVLVKLQQLGCVHLRSVNQTKSSAVGAREERSIDTLKTAIKYLEDSPIKGKLKTQSIDLNYNELLAKIALNQNTMREKIDRRDFLLTRIKDLSLWGNFELPAAHEIGNQRLWFYKIKKKELTSLPKKVVLHEIYRDNQYHYIVIISLEEPNASLMPVPRVHTGSTSLVSLKNELEKIREELDDLHEERLHLTRYLFLIRKQYAYYVDKTKLFEAAALTRDDEHVFIVQGWVPVSNLSDLVNFSEQHHLILSIEEVDQNDTPPTMLKTYHWSSAGVELVKFYQMPGYYSLDPSLLVFLSFTLFFAMILADAGYALVIAILTLLFWRKLSRMNSGVWLKPLLSAICLVSFIYGVMVGSYFGVSPAPNTILAKLKVLDINDFKTMMTVVLVIGCLHIIAANLMRVWFARSSQAKIQSLSYAALIIGVMSAIAASQYHSNILMIPSIVIILLSILMVMVSASDLPVTNFNSFIKRILYGLAELMQLSSLFGDILSYLRLFALGLAGASLAVTFNQIARQIVESSPHGYGWVMAFLVLMLGQSLNFILCLMSAVIHGLRLNYIEFFKWSIKEEGYPYEPLKKMEVNHE